jgi:hypothetical protein
MIHNAGSTRTALIAGTYQLLARQRSSRDCAETAARVPSSPEKPGEIERGTTHAWRRSTMLPNTLQAMGRYEPGLTL